MGELSKLPNIGEVVEEQFKDVGINSHEYLKNAGARETWLRIRVLDDSAFIHSLYSFEGAITLGK